MCDSLYDQDLESCSLWIKDAPPVPLSTLSRFKRWLFPALMAAVVLVVIVVLGATNAKMSNRLLSSEENASSLNNRMESLNASLQKIEESVHQVHQDHQEQRSDINNNKDQLTSVFEALKQLPALNTISKTVNALRCSLDRYIKNGSTSENCCSLGWETSGSSCYFFSKTSLSWHDARDWCIGQGSHLVILMTDKEWNFVTRHSSGTFYWVGLTDEKSGKWEWVNQTPYVMNRRRWMPGQPDSWTGHGLGSGDEDCAHLHYDGRLNDMHCSHMLHFICQKHSLSLSS